MTLPNFLESKGCIRSICMHETYIQRPDDQLHPVLEEALAVANYLMGYREKSYPQKADVVDIRVHNRQGLCF